MQADEIDPRTSSMILLGFVLMDSNTWLSGNPWDLAASLTVIIRFCCS
jgi:hypothetical protein